MNEAGVRASIKLLGKRVRDRVMGAEGVATGVTFELYGCVQVLVTQSADKDGKQRDLQYFDVNRLEVLRGERVMPLPAFDYAEPERHAVGGQAGKPVR